MFQRTELDFNELQKYRLDLIFFLIERMVLIFFKIYFASWYLNQFLMIIYCNEFAFQLYSVQYKIVFLSINAALEIVSEKLLYIVLCWFLEEMQMSGKYLSSIMLICVHGVSITWLMFSLKCFFSGIHKTQFYTFWVVHEVCFYVIILALKDTFFWQ